VYSGPLVVDVDQLPPLVAIVGGKSASREGGHDPGFTTYAENDFSALDKSGHTLDVSQCEWLVGTTKGAKKDQPQEQGKEKGKKGAKVWCPHCEFLVTPEGHADRCAPARVKSGWNPLKRSAWIGDVVHRLDVRRYLLLVGCGDDELGVREGELVNKDAQGKWYAAYDGPKEPAYGQTPKPLSDAFEASYKGRFRCDYVRSVLALPEGTVLSGALLELITGFSVSSSPLLAVEGCD